MTRSPLDPYTARTATDPDVILNRIGQARRDGYAVVVDEFVQGEVAIGIALERDGRPLGALHVAGSLSEWTPEAFVDRVAPLATEAARAVIGSL